MRPAIHLFFVVLAMPLLQAQTAGSSPPKIEWKTNYEEAILKAKADSLPIFMFFTGSDWCSWCNKLEHETLSTPAFSEAVHGKFIFLKLDFPIYASADPRISAQNKVLQQKYDIRSFPTVILLDVQQMKVIERIEDNRSNNPKAYAAKLNKSVTDYVAYQQKMQQIGQEKHSGVQLRLLYEKAKSLAFYSDISRIIYAGLQSDDKRFFQLERYRFLVEEGSMRDPEALSLRQELLASDPLNQNKIHYQIAVIDFEAFSEEIDKETYSPDIAVGPLVNYIEKFGKQDPENLWRLEMLISQVYLDHNKIPQALKYAQSSHDAAPPRVQSDIAKAIRNIQVYAQMH